MTTDEKTRAELRLRCIEAASRVFEGHGIGETAARRAWIAGAVKELASEFLDWVDPMTSSPPPRPLRLRRP